MAVEQNDHSPFCCIDRLSDGVQECNSTSSIPWNVQVSLQFTVLQAILFPVNMSADNFFKTVVLPEGPTCSLLQLELPVLSLLCAVYLLAPEGQSIVQQHA